MEARKVLIAGAFAYFACSAPSAPPEGSASFVAVIQVSASTNTAAIDVVVHADGTAERTVEPFRAEPARGPEELPSNDPAIARFLSDFASAGDVVGYDIGGCPKSESFGTTTKITTPAGETSGDLQCLSLDAPAAQLALAHDCDMLTGR